MSDDIRVGSDEFEILPDGRFASPNWILRALISFMVYTPDSWISITQQLRELPQFNRNLDVYGLVYAFCLVMISGDPILRPLVTFHFSRGQYTVSAGYLRQYDGVPNPLDFWRTNPGHMLLQTALDIFEDDNPEFEDAGRVTISNPIFVDFMRQVDLYSSITRSVSVR